MGILDSLFRRRTGTTATATAFDAGFIRRLELLIIAAARASGSLRYGRRPGRATGGRLVFQDYREFAPGDDIRMIDWNVYARTDRLYVKVYTREENARLTILLDASASMAFGSPSKLDRAKQLAASLAHIAVFSGDSAQIVILDGSTRSLGVFHSRDQSAEILDALDSVEPTGRAGIDDLKIIAARQPQRGSLALISDCWWDVSRLSELSALALSLGPAALIPVLSDADLNAPPPGRWRIADSETGDDILVEGGADMAEKFRRVVNGRLETLRSFCRSSGICFAEWLPDATLEEIVFGSLRQTGYFEE
ncbi:MAG: DUF58 domain-containing protein [Planctomycetota bacterium]